MNTYGYILQKFKSDILCPVSFRMPLSFRPVNMGYRPISNSIWVHHLVQTNMQICSVNWAAAALGGWQNNFSNLKAIGY